jgi:hypothetical protein
MHLWRKIQGLLRLSFGAEFEERKAPEAARAVLARAAGASDFAELRRWIIAAAADSHRYFAEIIEAPAAALPGSSPRSE